MASRREHDSLGEKDVPADAYYGIQTLRAVENFPISGRRASPYLIRATALVKKAAALTNVALGQLDQRRGEAIVAAADEVIAGRWHDQFVVDYYQAGAGVSHNMNANEVLANRAIELLGGQKGDYSEVHPNDHVNRAQSTNDVFPTAARLAALFLLEELLAALDGLEAALRVKATEFDDVLKSARTHLQDAVPIRLGQEFQAYAVTMTYNQKRLRQAAIAVAELNIGATAAGTGLNAHPDYPKMVVAKLAELSGLALRQAPHLVEATQSPRGLTELSAVLKLLAVDLNKISSDLILLSSGPKTGFGEINLPELQPGSSIMPGKVNPVMCEVLNMVCYQVVGHDLAITLAAQASQLELNVAMPLMAHNLHHSLEILKNVVSVFTERCVRGITANVERAQQLFEDSLGLATVLSPYIGYEAAAKLAQEAKARNIRVRDLVLEKGLFTAERLAEIMEPRSMTEPGVPGASPGKPTP